MSEKVFVFPLSFAQQRLWFLDQISPGNAFYNIHDAIYFEHPLNVEALKQSIGEIIARHEILRTTFSSIDGHPVQVIAAELTTPFSLSDLSSLPEMEREAELLRLSAEEARHPFDLSRGPLVRTRLLRLGPVEHLLLLTMHHIISDGWSLEVLKRELGVLYEAFSAGEPSPLAELPIQYADFAVWQKDRLRGEVLEEQLSYWKQQLAGAPASLELPTDRPRPPVQTFRGASQWLNLPRSLADALKTIGMEEGVTLFMTGLAAFKALLYRYTGQPDIIVGSPIAGRNHAELDGMIGFFVNTLVLRTRLDGGSRFRELLQHVRETALGAYAHQDLPFEKLVEELHPKRDTSRNPLVQVMFDLQNAASGALSGSDEEASFEDGLEQEYIERGSAKFDLSMALQESEKGLSVFVEYSTDLFDDSTIRRMLGHFRRLLEGAAHNPDQTLSRLPLLSPEEERQLLFEWNDTGADRPDESCLHELFEAEAARRPEATAVTFNHEHLTYGELNRRANHLARRLREMGVDSASLVGVCMERSVELVVGVLSVLKAGGAYVPLDPEYPKERLAFMIEDAGISVLLAQERVAASLPASADARVLFVDAGRGGVGAEWERYLPTESVENLSCETTGENTAYVLYTSGSTGTPKGVAITHRAVNRLVRRTNYIDIQEDDQIAQSSSFSFDAAAFEIWGALLNGAHLIVLPKEVLLAPQRLAEEIREAKISILFLTTALFNQFADDIPGAFRSLRYLLFGGEAADPFRVRRVLEDSNLSGRLVNLYGPAENTTLTTWHPVEAVPAQATSIPIGRPVANTQVYILDAELQPVPVGVAGEICIGGDGLARGYPQRAELTAEKFIPNPFSREGGARLYRTGDLGRYLATGEIEFLGRRDYQVKIRGFRVELEEIEAALKRYSGLKDAVVVTNENATDDKRLIAYLVAYDEDAVPSPGELRAFLRERLPPYMIPNVFVALGSLPLTANGKVDRRALPAPVSARQEEDEQYAAPQTEMEHRVVAIWREVLGAERIGVHDNFFDLGGHSLLIVRVHNKLRETLHREIPIVELFRHPTVTALSEYLGAKEPSALEAMAAANAFDPVQARAEKKREAIKRQQQRMTGRALIYEQ
jgi:amino acid adenylation domain-containing protein